MGDTMGLGNPCKEIEDGYLAGGITAVCTRKAAAITDFIDQIIKSVCISGDQDYRNPFKG